MLLRLAFVLFAAAFVSIIMIADLGMAGRMWSFVGMVPYGDKLGHLALVGTLTVLLNLNLKRRPCGVLMLGSVIVLAAMTLEEGSQVFFPMRSFDGYDALANLVGVICGEGLVRMLPRRQVPPPAWTRRVATAAPHGSVGADNRLNARPSPETTKDGQGDEKLLLCKDTRLLSPILTLRDRPLVLGLLQSGESLTLGRLGRLRDDHTAAH